MTDEISSVSRIIHGPSLKSERMNDFSGAEMEIDSGTRKYRMYLPPQVKKILTFELPFLSL